MNQLFLKIDKRILNLNDSQAFIYLMIVYCKFQRRQVNRKYLAEALGVTNKEYVSDLITAVEDAGMIKRNNYFKNSYKEGWIDIKLDWELLYKKDDYFEVSVDFVRNRDVNARTKGFALRYRSLAFDDTLKIGYNKKDTASKLGVTPPTLRKYMYLWNTLELASYFHKQEANKQTLTEDQLDELKTLASNSGNVAIKKQCQWYLNNGLQNHNRCVDLYNKAVSGILFKKKNKSNTRNE